MRLCPLCNHKGKRMVHTKDDCYTRLANDSRLYVRRT